MGLQDLFSTLLRGTGVHTVLRSTRDVKLLLAQRFVRLVAYGATFLILVHFLASLGVSDKLAGLFMTLTMLGDALISFVLVLITDQVGRRKILVLGAVLMIVSGTVFATSRSFWVLVLASVLGVISPSGNEIGPFRAVEESILAQQINKNDRTDIFAWYTMFGTAGAAIGTIVSGWLVQWISNDSVASRLRAYRIIFLLYAVLGVIKVLLVLSLSANAEFPRKEIEYEEVIELENEGLLSQISSPRTSEEAIRHDVPPPHRLGTPQRSNPFRSGIVTRFCSYLPKLSSKSLPILFRLIVLFSLDSFASGMASPSWLTYFFTTYHDVNPGSLGTLFFVTNILATISNLVALPLARRLGPLKTMTFTHLPSAIFLGLTALPRSGNPGTFISMVLLSLRACTQSMDQAPRQAFLAAVMRPEERTAMLGIVNIQKTIAQAGGIGTSGILAAQESWRIMLGGAGLMKVFYDLLILWTFLHMPDREDERA